MTRCGVVIPVRAFSVGKARLADRLDTNARIELGRRLADSVAAAAGELPTVVVSSAPEVRDWARDRALAVVDDPGSLDRAASAGRAWVAGRGLVRAVVVHADLPHAHTLTAVTRDGGQPIVTAVPCHRDDGTPVLAVPVDVPFRFSYGPSSYRRHAAEARRLGLGFRVVRDADLAFDVDVSDDLEALEEAWSSASSSQARRRLR
jgi:2-phospho-L-lactate/phosphoenolpyruvate guanylyltransferase